MNFLFLYIIEHSYEVKKEKAESDFKFSIKAIDDENKKIREQIEIVNYNAEQQKKVAKDKKRYKE